MKFLFLSYVLPISSLSLSLLINNNFHDCSKMNHFMSLLLTLVLFLYIPVSSSINPSYGICKIKKCGNVNITYPFYIVKEQESQCGYPGFEVSCQDQIPHINISGDSYVIQQIWYQNQSFQVINSAIAVITNLMEGKCPSSIKNMTLDNSIYNFVSDHKDTILLLNCQDKYLGKYGNDSVKLRCRAVAMYDNNDKGLNDLAKNCSSQVGSVPYEGKRNDRILETLRNGILLNWTVNNCSACTETGGQCGFNRATHEFKCFCPDKDHVYHCVPSDSLAFDYYKACKPKKCGDLTIRYPFYIKGQQEPICGYPGFQVSCKSQNNTIINLSSNDYLIVNISYELQSVNLVIFDFVHKVFVCSPVIHNLTLGGTMFEFGGEHSEVYLLQNCSDEARRSIRMYKEVLCYYNNVEGELLAAFAKYIDLNKVAGECSRVVVVPYGGKNDSDIQGEMKSGLLLRWKVSNCPDSCGETGGLCGSNRTDSQLRCFCPDGLQSDRCHTKKKNVGLIAGLSVAGGAIMLTLASIAYWYRKKLKFNHSQFVSRSNSLDRATSDIEKGSIYFGVPLFSYSELEEATDNFNHCRELGDGGFGTVYYGKLKDGREVAVKRLFEKSYKRVEQFMNEVQILTCLRHQNLVSLYGCTSHHSRELLLVYEFVPNGTVADHLYGEIAKSRSLPWHVRMRIAIETASALSYLHASDIIHRDVKTNNILLDSSFSVKVADFGLSRLFPNDVTHVSTAPQGTPGYLDPEYHQCYQLTDKSDVYSYGVVLIELISSLPAVDMDRHRQEINLSNYAMNRIQRCAFDELVDPKLGFTSDFKVRKMTTAVAELAFQCLQPDKEFRPSMDEVLVNLKRIESADYEALKTEKATKNDGIGGSSTPPPSPTENDDAKLLTNHQANPCSPNSVMDKWGSKNTTPNTSK